MLFSRSATPRKQRRRASAYRQFDCCSFSESLVRSIHLDNGDHFAGHYSWTLDSVSAGSRSLPPMVRRTAKQPRGAGDAVPLQGPASRKRRKYTTNNTVRNCTHLAAQAYFSYPDSHPCMTGQLVCLVTS